MLLYFSATGNSLAIAKRLDKEPISIATEMKKEERIYEDDVIGMVVPDYYSELPNIVREFIKTSTFKCQYFYILVTYGRGDRIVAKWSKDFLEENGVKVNYANVVLMADNYVPAFDMSEEIQIEKHIDEQMEVIIRDIGERKEWYKEPTSEAMDAYLASRGDGFDAKVVSDSETITVDLERCIGCGICSKVCPIHNIKIENKNAVRINKTCEACLACVHACPKKAIYLKGRDKNREARYINPEVKLLEIIEANKQ